jgi:hypothetical protein
MVPVGQRNDFQRPQAEQHREMEEDISQYVIQNMVGMDDLVTVAGVQQESVGIVPLVVVRNEDEE